MACLVGDLAWHFLAIHADKTLAQFPLSVLQCITNIPSDLLNELADRIRDLLVHTTVFRRGIGACETRTAELLLDGFETLVEVVTVISSTGVAGVVGVVHVDEEDGGWGWWMAGACWW